MLGTLMLPESQLVKPQLTSDLRLMFTYMSWDLLLNGVNVAPSLSEVDLLRERLVVLENFVKYFELKLGQVSSSGK